jgi:hypothetical protein
MLAWTFATPQMGSPDESAHAIRAAAVVRGELSNQPVDGTPATNLVHVPRWASSAIDLTCFAHHSDVAAACQPEWQDIVGDPNEIVPTITTASGNGPVYYLLTGLPSLFSSWHTAFYLMRVISAVLTAALLAFTFMAVRQLPRSRWSTIALTTAVTPMVLFLGGVLNPNAVEFAAAAAIFATLVLVFRQPSPGVLLWERGAIVVLGASVAGARNISLLWLVLALGLALLFARWTIIRQLFKRTATWLTLALTAAAAGLTFLWFAQFFGTGTDPGGGPGRDASFHSAFLTMIETTLEYCQAWIGAFGWLDRLAPLLAVAIWTTMIVSITVAALLLARRSARLAIVIVLLAIVLVPAVSIATVVSLWGFGWQGRYTLALLFFLLLACGIALDTSRFPPPKGATVAWNRVLAAALVLMGIGHVATFAWVLVRYVIGTGNPTWHMFTQPRWQPPLTWEGLTLLFAAIVTIGLWFVWRATRFTTSLDDRANHGNQSNEVTHETNDHHPSRVS